MKENSMVCARCGGAMTLERFNTREGAVTAQPYDGWRCLCCGEIIDPLILHNRQRVAGRKQLKTAERRRQVA